MEELDLPYDAIGQYDSTIIPYDGVLLAPQRVAAQAQTLVLEAQAQA